jgi:glycosyltransferase involved in cell wall biosynthesis
MVVKNEAGRIVNCLESVLRHIDQAIIIDNNSTDRTRDIMEKYFSLRNIPFDISISYVADNMGLLRSQSLELSEHTTCDYRLVLDADNEFVCGEKHAFAGLTADAVYINKRQGSITFPVLFMFRSNKQFRYYGVIHEFAAIAQIDGVYEAPNFTTETLDRVTIYEPAKAHNPDKYAIDALNIERAQVLQLRTGDTLIDALLHTRYQFYLGQSWKDAGRGDRAIKAYTTRTRMGGWEEEIYYSFLSIARIIHDEHREGAVAAYLDAWEYRPQRLEAAYELMQILVSYHRYALAFAIATVSMRLQPCTDILFLEHEVYGHLFNDLYLLILKKINQK